MGNFLRFVGALLFFGVISYTLMTGGPRIWSDITHASEYAPARQHTFVSYKCKTWNLFMFNECTSTYTSNKTNRSEEITDWRLGWAPSDRAQLLESKTDPIVVTTTVSIATIINRSVFYLSGCVVWLLMLLGIVLAARNAMSGARGGGPADPQR